MLNAAQRAFINRPVTSGGARTPGTVAAVAWQAATAAFHADDQHEVERDTQHGSDASDAVGSLQPSSVPGAVSYLAALMIAAALVFIWVGVRSL